MKDQPRFIVAQVVRETGDILIKYPSTEAVNPARAFWLFMGLDDGKLEQGEDLYPTYRNTEIGVEFLETDRFEYFHVDYTELPDIYITSDEQLALANAILERHEPFPTTYRVIEMGV